MTSLRHRMIEDLRLRNYAERTVDTYVCRPLIGCGRPVAALDQAGGDPAADPEAQPPLCPSCRLGRLLPPEILSPAASNVQESARDP